MRPPEGNRSIASAVYGTGGDLYYCDATETRIYRIHEGHVEEAYRHNGYIRHLAVDSAGRLYFSVVGLMHDDGSIFRLDSGRAVPVLTVNAADLGGSWSGTFALDRNDKVWLSSGAASPSGLYQVINGAPVQVYSATDHAIMGFAFLPDGSIAFADNARSVYQLTLPNQVAKLFESPYEGRLTDVQIGDRGSM